jgi:hypothetical protein
MAESDIESLETTLRLLQALGFARRGRLREAQAVIAPGGTPPADSLSLHALAALTTGAGDYRMALPLWRLLLEREPDHAEARRMIAAIELWQARPPWMKWVWPLVGSVLGVVLLVVLLQLL